MYEESVTQTSESDVSQFGKIIPSLLTVKNLGAVVALHDIYSGIGLHGGVGLGNYLHGKWARWLLYSIEKMPHTRGRP